MDEHSHHEHQEGDFQVSKEGDSLCEQKGKGYKGGMRELAIDITYGVSRTSTPTRVHLC